MRTTLLALAATAAVALTGSAALAQDAAAKPGAMIVSSDGKRIGRIDRIVSDRAGQAQSASVIFDSRFISVPVNTLTVGSDGRATTSLTRKEISALR